MHDTPGRSPLLARYDGWVLGFVTVAALALVLSDGFDLRRFSNALGVAAFGLMAWRIVSTWDRLTVLEHIGLGLLALSPVVAAAASFGLLARTDDLPTNPLLWLVVAHRVAMIVLVVFWNRWLGRRHSPFRSQPATPRST